MRQWFYIMLLWNQSSDPLTLSMCWSWYCVFSAFTTTKAYNRNYTEITKDQKYWNLTWNQQWPNWPETKTRRNRNSHASNLKGFRRRQDYRHNKCHIQRWWYTGRHNQIHFHSIGCNWMWTSLDNQSNEPHTKTYLPKLDEYSSYQNETGYMTRTVRHNDLFEKLSNLGICRKDIRII